MFLIIPASAAVLIDYLVYHTFYSWIDILSFTLILFFTVVNSIVKLIEPSNVIAGRPRRSLNFKKEDSNTTL